MVKKKTGDGIEALNSSWSFKGSNLVKKFDKHISSSVPLYKEGHELITSLSDFFISLRTFDKIPKSALLLVNTHIFFIGNLSN